MRFNCFPRRVQHVLQPNPIRAAQTAERQSSRKCRLNSPVVRKSAFLPTISDNSGSSAAIHQIANSLVRLEFNQ